MKFAVIAEETDYDIYDMSIDPIAGIEVVEAESEEEAIEESWMNREQLQYRYYAYPVGKDTPLGDTETKPEPS